ncbi:MAG: type II secretion system major pseudopilin GspG [Nitrospinota bacterium]|nr:type II secretion system major pseudopilin GspG [Nitrospinota bacterium]
MKILSCIGERLGAWAKSIRRDAGNEKGFTLIEIMVVVIILSLLAGIVIPRIVSRPEEARRAKAGVQIKSIEGALNLFKIDNGFYPSTEQGLQALVEEPKSGELPSNYKDGGYLKKVPMDPWNHEYVYLSPGPHGDFDLMSYGPDGEEGGEGKNADINNWELE